MAQENQLIVLAKESGLEERKVENLLLNFAESFDQAKEIAATASEIVVTDESQTAEMALARASRLKLKNIRVDVEKLRKGLKEQSLREGKAIDGMANIIKALIVPLEEKLEKQEKFAEVKAEERRVAKHAERVEKLSEWVEDVSVYSLNDMTDSGFEALLVNAKLAYKAKKGAEEQAERERLEAEEVERLERERMREENARLLKEREDEENLQKQRIKERTPQLETLGMAKRDDGFFEYGMRISWLDISMSDNEKWKVILEAAKDRMNIFKEEEATKKAKDIELENERKAREAAELKIKQDEEARLQQEQKAKEAERQALLAPDKDKLNVLAETIDKLDMPSVKNESAGAILNETKDFLNRISKNLRNKANEL